MSQISSRHSGQVYGQVIRTAKIISIEMEARGTIPALASPRGLESTSHKESIRAQPFTANQIPLFSLNEKNRKCLILALISSYIEDLTPSDLKTHSFNRFHRICSISDSKPGIILELRPAKKYQNNS